MKAYNKVAISECIECTGRKPIAVRWVDINKGDTANPNYRSRLVAKEFRGNDDRPEWFTATPPSECWKFMLHQLASTRGHKLLYADVSRAHFYGQAVRSVYVQLPEEDRGGDGTRRDGSGEGEPRTRKNAGAGRGGWRRLWCDERGQRQG